MRKVLTENQIRRLVRFLIEMNVGDTISQNDLLSAEQVGRVIDGLKNAPEVSLSMTVADLLKMSTAEINDLSKSRADSGSRDGTVNSTRV